VAVTDTVIVEVPVGVGTDCVTGALWAPVLPPPHPAAVHRVNPASARKAVPARQGRGLTLRSPPSAGIAPAQRVSPAKGNRKTRSRRSHRSVTNGVSRGGCPSAALTPLPAVATVITKGTETPVVTFIVAGAEQVADTGAPEHVDDKLPVKPAVSCRLNVAVCPALTVAERLPDTVSSEFAFPVTATVCGEFGASSAIVTVAVRAPVAEGVKVSPTVQAVLMGYAEATHSLIRVKSPALVPLNLIEEKWRAAAPRLVTVMFCLGLVVPSAVEANETAVEERVTDGAPAPEPVS